MRTDNQSRRDRLQRGEKSSRDGRVERGVVQFATVVGLLGALALALFGPVPAHLPGIAFDSETMYVLERSAAAFLGWTAFVGLVIWGIRGEVASGFGRDGLTFGRVEQAASDLQASLDRNTRTLQAIERRVGDTETHQEQAGKLAAMMSEQLAELRGRLPET
jgi:hypothetical protein